ncbi:MAG: hypothetical protein Q9209_002218 [Squamulea sp. 1 TL-2023]
MKLTALLLGFLPALISAECYSGGESWDRTLATSAVDTACKEFAGDYHLNESKQKTIDVFNGQCYSFVLQRITGGDGDVLREITEDECKNGMNHEVNGCEHGGHSSYTDWSYKADPNKGPC